MSAIDDLWRLVWGRPQVDPRALAEAVGRAAAEPSLDYRTRLLIRDSADALERHWGGERWRGWLNQCRTRANIEAIGREPFDEPGFPLVGRRLMDRTEPEVIRQFLRELGSHLHRPAPMAIRGVIALILPGHLSRSTDAIDVVDEVPAELRQQPRLLDDLAQRFGLRLTHFQSHFLPSGWEGRIHTLEPYGQLHASLVDVYDVFLGKLFSPRDKDRDDLRLLLPGLDRETVRRRLQDTCGRLLADDGRRAQAERNWYILTGEPLPG